MKIKKDELFIDRLSHLAALSTDDMDVDTLYRDMSDMLDMVDKLDEVDVTGVSPMIQPIEDISLKLRDDETKVSGEDDNASLRKDILDNAPLIKDDMYVVSRSIG